MKKAKVALFARLLLGLAFTVFGLNGFLNFIPAPASMPEAAGQFAGALMATKYMFPMIKSFELLSGLMLLTGFQVPLALLFLSPIVVNIFAFHFFLTGPSTVGMALAIIALMLATAWGYSKNFAPLFKKMG